MCDGRDYLLRVWQLAEELAVQSGKPLHAFLLLHNLLIQPPPQLRHASEDVHSALPSSFSSAPTTAAAVAATPLNAPSLDAEWKCEELATRVRAAEYLLFSDVSRPAQKTAVEPSWSCASPPTHTLSRAAALESLELAERVLAPVFATSSHVRTDISNRSHDFLRATSASAPSFSHEKAARDGTGAVGTCAASMYFFSESTVTTLAWPLTHFSLAWPSSETASHLPTPPFSSFSFKAASQTIMIAVALVVRAHVLQAVVCHRRVQYKRALQCLAEARKWARQQFTASAQTRSLRLMWADLQERFCVSVSSRSCSFPSLLLPQHLPHFEDIMRRLMELERRACDAMISVEECKVHFLILQSCGSLPPPPLLLSPLPLPSSESSTTVSINNNKGSGNQPSVNLPDLRLHCKRYQESVQQLHQVSTLYMRILEWIEEEEGNTNGRQGEEEGEQRVRRKREDEEDEKCASLTVEHVRLAQSQLSPFCLCTLHHSDLSFSYSAMQKRSTKVHEQHGHVVGVKAELDETSEGDPLLQRQQPQCTRRDNHGNFPCVANYDKRLAAEVLGLYHCVSFLYLLYQHRSATTSANSHNNVGQRLRSLEKMEAEFFERYPCVASVMPPTNAVQRALMHFRIYAFVFGDFSIRSGGDGAAAGLRWRSHATRAAGPLSFSPPPKPAHEAALLLCLAELALTDNFPFAMHFFSGLGGSTNALTRRTAAMDSSGNATGFPAVKKEEGDEEQSPPLHARERSTPAAVEAAALSRKRDHFYSSSLDSPPPSWHWVLPGVRTALQLFVELATALMQATATTQVSSSESSRSPPLTPASTTRTTTTITSMEKGAAPPVPILQAGLQRAEQLLARLLFTLDREMLQLTGNAWSLTTASPSSASSTANTRFCVFAPAQLHQQHQQSSIFHNEGGSLSLLSTSSLTSLTPWISPDHLQSSSSAQLRWLVQIKVAALLTVARHHLTQLSIVRAVHYLSEVQQFIRVFHRQAKQTLLPEMHALLAAVATCMSLRRLPDLHTRQRRQQQRQQVQGGYPGSKRSREAETTVSEGEEGDEHPGVDITDKNAEGIPGTHPSDAGGGVGDALCAFAQGWPSIDSASVSVSSLHAWHTANGEGGDGGPPPSSSVFSIHPREEATIAQDVGMPYLHLLAAERAACTSLCTPPSFMLLLYLMKAWAVYQLVAAGEEIKWVEGAEQKQQPNSNAISPLSPACPPLALPTASYATTKLHNTVTDQQRRVARLDSLTSTPTNTPTLRSRHATLPAEMQRIQLDASALPPSMKPVESLAAATANTEDKSTPLHTAVAVGSPPPSDPTVALHAMKKEPTAVAPARLSPPVRPLPPAVHHRAPLEITVQVTQLPLTVRHRAGDVLQRMMVVLQHHYDAYTLCTASSSTSTDTSSSPSLEVESSMAWTPQNVTLFRLLRGAVMLTEDRDEPAAARALKDTTHYAKQHLGVLHPYVADGLALLTNAYASLDVDAASNEDSVPSTGATGRGRPQPPPSYSLSSPSPSSSMQPDSAARTKRVAVQLALRCSCTALASLAVSDSTSSSASYLLKSPAAAPPATTLNGVGSSNSNSASSLPHGQQLQQTEEQNQQQMAALHNRLHEWWCSQVLEVCGNGSVQRSTHAVKHLQVLFGWMSGTTERRC